MTFLQPLLLWGLPLLFVPLIIHLFNRMRYRSMPWAAMMFLYQANRQAPRSAKLRHILILLFRMLAVAALVLALCRPLVGGWLGWAMRPTPDTVIVLLDRSASMETMDPETRTPKRERALSQMVDAAKTMGKQPRFVLFESASRLPHEIADPALIDKLPVTQGTDTAADIPVMLEDALDYIRDNKTGRTEVWLASDLQESNWQSDSRRWVNLREGFSSLPLKPQIRLLASTQRAGENIAATVRDVKQVKQGDNYRLHLTVELTRDGTGPASFPLAVVLEGGRSLVNVKMDGSQLRLHHQLDLGNKPRTGWGYVELPRDSNLRDNTGYFVFGEEVPLQATVVAPDTPMRKLLQLAASPPRAGATTIAAAGIRPEDAASVRWADTSLVVWHAPIPTESAADSLRQFVEDGGVVIFFPATEPGGLIADVGWGAPQQTVMDKLWTVGTWRNDYGPLAKSLEGQDLPLSELVFLKRRLIKAGQVEQAAYATLASFNDGEPLLVRRPLGRGAMYFCAALPGRDWSNLGDGTVLVPMLQRMLWEGGNRFGSAKLATVGDPSVVESKEPWKRVETAAGSVIAKSPDEVALRDSPAVRAGIYQSGKRMVAVNRPAREDSVEFMNEKPVKALFEGLPMWMFADEGGGADSKLQNEIWRLFLWAMLIFLIGEAVLTLPGKARESSVGMADGGRPGMPAHEPQLQEVA